MTGDQLSGNIAGELPARQHQGLSLLRDEGPMDGATFAKAMWMRHGISPGQSGDLLNALLRKRLVVLEGRGKGHKWSVAAAMRTEKP